MYHVSTSGDISKERAESKVIQRKCTIIAENIATQHLAQWFASRLTEEDLIMSSDYFCVMGVPDSVQVIQMLQAVQCQLKTTGNPERMIREFITILENVSSLKELARQITSSYGKQNYHSLYFCQSIVIISP